MESERAKRVAFRGRFHVLHFCRGKYVLAYGETKKRPSEWNTTKYSDGAPAKREAALTCGSFSLFRAATAATPLNNNSLHLFAVEHGAENSRTELGHTHTHLFRIIFVRPFRYEQYKIHIRTRT